MQNLVASKGETCCAGKSVSTPKFLRKCGRECGSQRPFRGREVVRELVYNDELTATQWALNSAVECHPHTVEVVGSNPTAPTIFSMAYRGCRFPHGSNRGKKTRLYEEGLYALHVAVIMDGFSVLINLAWCC